MRTKREFLYDLKNDPHETANIVNNPAAGKTLGLLRKDLDIIYLNQYLLEKDRIWDQ